MAYTEIRFGGGADESSDVSRWHENIDTTKKESALIIPRVTAVGMLWAKIAWESFVARYSPSNPEHVGAEAPTKYYLKFVRDPFTSKADQTGAVHFAAVEHGQNHVTSWLGMLRAGQPFALLVMHNGNRPLDITLAEYKAWVP
jgi:hypothetical protein